MSITIVIPCYPPHQKYIPGLLEQLNHQTVKPDAIVIALSEVNEQDIIHLEKEWKVFTSIPLKVVGQEQKANASVNRNYGALFVTTEYIQFLDADDTYDVRLIEIQKEQIQEQNPQAIIYHLTHEKLTDQLQCINEPVVLTEAIFDSLYPTGKKEDAEIFLNHPLPDFAFSKGQIHCGHLLVKTEVILELPQPDILGAEDSHQIRNLVWYWHEQGRRVNGIILIPHILTSYMGTGNEYRKGARDSH